MKRVFLAALLLLTMATIGFAQSNKPLLMRNPTVSSTHIVFSYAGDLWIVPRTGGEAARLTTGTGTEGIPIFSPDGQWIAFTGEYDGNVDIYVVAATGGIPKRLTYHPGTDIIAGWTPDGKSVLFRSGRNSESGRTAQLFTIPADGVTPTMVPLPMAYDGSFSPDGSRLAYEPLGRAFQAWKRYRGGRTSPIWIANLADSSVEKLPRENSNDFSPMWIDNRVYFLSDRNGTITLFAYDTASKKVSQVIANTGLDIKSASAGAGAIVYEQFGALNLYDLKAGKSQKLNISINGDMLAVRPRFEKLAGSIANTNISPGGARAII